MTARRFLQCIAAAGILAALGCGDITAPTLPLQKTDSPTTPVGAVFSRWMLISGVWVCVDKCDDRQIADAAGQQTVPPGSDKLSQPQ